MKLAFRRMNADDLRLLYEWLQREHVRKWWSKHESYEEVVEHYLPAVEEREPTDLYVILLDDHPAGFIQTYLVSDYGDYRKLVDVEERVAGVDLFLAEAERIGRGLGSRVLADFLRDVVFAVPTTRACVADPDAENAASVRAFEKAGFRRVREFADPDDDNRRHVLMRIER
jgi:RimJ/RimL family protein N-acetyltransferase